MSFEPQEITLDYLLPRHEDQVAIVEALNRPDFRSVLQARMELDEQEVLAGDA